MKKLTVIFTVIFLLCVSVFNAGAEELTFDYSPVYNSLSDEALQKINELGLGADASSASNLSFEGVMSMIFSAAKENAAAPMKGLLTVTAILLICSMLTAYQNSLSGDVKSAVNTAAALCISCSVAAPAVSFISGAGSVVKCAANLFLSYVPITAVMMTASGNPFSSASYYGAMLASGQGTARICSDIVLPLTNLFLGVSVTAGAAPGFQLSGLSAQISKLIKWLLGFAMTVFTAVLSFRQIAAGALDSAAVRTAKFALSSFVPMVGSALAEAYRSVQGSVAVLKSGLGIFVIVALGITFLPVVIKAVLWALCLNIGKTFAAMLGISQCASLLEALASVFSVIIAVLFCVMTVFIISTAAAFTIGGGA